MLTQEARDELERQHYRIVGEHSAVKTCGWTKKAIKNEGFCYKFKFYGINSHQCLQMTTSISCANRCCFCWRDYKAPVAKEWKWDMDEPQDILTGSLAAQKRNLSGIKGCDWANKKLVAEAAKVKHVALSLTGEPIMYPRLNELIDVFHKEKVSTFLVTNAQYPKEIAALQPITQFYISLDAPSQALLKQVDNPLFTDYWKRCLESLDALRERKDRTAIRLTLIKGINMEDAKGYAELLTRAQPDFIEIKAYMYLGASRERLEEKNMPRHHEVVEFAEQVEQLLEGYEKVTEHEQSRVVLLAKKKFKVDGVWHTWIDFEKFHGLTAKGEPFAVEDFWKKTPVV